MDQAIARRSPANENDTLGLQRLIQKISGLRGDEVIGKMTDEQLQRLIEAIKRTEGWKEGQIKIVKLF